MCDECGESPGLYVAYFNKPGGSHWRPARNAAAAPVAVDRHAIAPVPVESVPVTLPEGTVREASTSQGLL